MTSTPSSHYWVSNSNPWSVANNILTAGSGARAYYMHSVLHDWPDDVCERILANVKNAMERGYSKLLINENVIPDVQAHWEATALDMMMLALFASKERTAAQWKHLLEDRAGLKIVKIWDVGNGVESLIECELP